MSDGPYRSLNMRQGWKKVAKFAHYDAFELEDVREAVSAAFTQDWNTDVPKVVVDCIHEILSGQSDSLFQDQKGMQLEALRPLVAGRGFGQVLLDCAIKSADSAKSGTNAIVEAVRDALDVWGARHSREIEEHYYRRSAEWRANNVRARIEQAIGSIVFDTLARQLIRIPDVPVRRTPLKRTGLDDGVSL